MMHHLFIIIKGYIYNFWMITYKSSLNFMRWQVSPYQLLCMHGSLLSLQVSRIISIQYLRSTIFADKEIVRLRPTSTRYQPSPPPPCTIHSSTNCPTKDRIAHTSVVFGFLNKNDRKAKGKSENLNLLNA